MNKKDLERLYEKANRSALLHTDPVLFLHRYGEKADQEAMGLIAACLAYGRVAQIRKSVETVLAKLSPAPRDFLLSVSSRERDRLFGDFRHRFAAGQDLCALLSAIQALLVEYGSLEAAFAMGHDPGAETVLPGLARFHEKLCQSAALRGNHLVPDPGKGSACKRLHLFLRWMVRRDRVDPGPWKCASPAQLIVPLDTHMHRVCRELGFTKRKTPDLVAALEATRVFRALNPEDPVRYDFALTRAGILGKPLV